MTTVTDPQALTDVQRDALREVANIGAGHAATALSLLTGTKILISVPTITTASLPDLAPVIAAGGDPVVLVPMEMTGGLHGHAIPAFPLVTARRLAALILRRPAPPEGALSEIESGALLEAGNILAGAYMTALSEFMRLMLLPSPPSLTVGPAREVLRATAARVGREDRYVFCVETQFLIDDVGDRIPGYFLLLPDAPSLGVMLAAVRLG